MTGTNGSTQNGLDIDPQALIDSLVQRVQQLTMENVMLQAAVNQLRGSEQVTPATEGAVS